MAEKTTIARPYAKAAFQEAQGDKRLPRWSETLRAAATAVRDPRVHELLGSPSVERRGSGAVRDGRYGSGAR